MGIFTNGLVLLFIFFAVSRIKALLRRNLSDVPLVTSAWNDGIKGKSFRSIVQTGYDTYSKASKAFRTENVFILPPSLFAEFRRLPSTVMNSSAANEQVLRLQRNLGADYWDAIQFVRQDVIRSIPSQIPVIQEEIQKHFSEKYTSDDGGWRSVAPWQTTFDMMSCFAARLLVGNGLCHDEMFLKKIGEFTRSVSVECIVLQKLPDFATSLLGPFLPAKNCVNALKEMLREPIMACVQTGENGIFEFREKAEYPNNSLLPQLIAHILPKLSAPITEAALLTAISGRLLGLLFAVIDTTTMTFTQVLFDLISNPESAYNTTLRKEITSVLAAHGGSWTLEALSELRHLDSFIHESQRLHPIGPALAARKCVSPSGHTFSNGDFIPFGALVQLPAWPIHIDPANYPNTSSSPTSNPLQFDGFRFANDAHPEGCPSDTFLSFGHGNHACPGRRFALVLVKLMVVEILLGYDFEVLGDRPEDWLFGAGIVPDMKRKIRMRRKRV